MQQTSLQGAAIAVVAAFAVRPTGALPQQIPGKIAPKAITAGSYDHNGPQPNPSGQPIATEANATHADYTPLTYHPGWTNIRASADCRGGRTELGAVAFKHEDEEEGPGGHGGLYKLTEQADMLARNCAMACSEQRRNATAAAAGEPEARQCRFFHMLLSTNTNSPYVTQECRLFSESWGAAYEKQFLTFPEVAFARWSWSASYAPEPSSGTCSPSDPAQPKSE